MPIGDTAFCLCASSIYVVNDLLDLQADRLHERKSKRPFAAGDVPLITGFILAPCLTGAAALLAAGLSGRFQATLLGYYILSVGYSLYLKRLLLVDVTTLACLYTLRIIAGAAAEEIALSFWLLLLSIFLFLSLAFVKRFVELDALRRKRGVNAGGRAYNVEDLSSIQALGGAAGYLSVLVLALYINSPDIAALYHRPKLIWVLCVLMLYWISYIWIKAHRGEVHDDPVVFSMKNPVSISLGVLAAVTVMIAV